MSDEGSSRIISRAVSAIQAVLTHDDCTGRVVFSLLRWVIFENENSYLPPSPHEDDEIVEPPILPSNPYQPSSGQSASWVTTIAVEQYEKAGLITEWRDDAPSQADSNGVDAVGGAEDHGGSGSVSPVGETHHDDGIMQAGRIGQSEAATDNDILRDGGTLSIPTSPQRGPILAPRSLLSATNASSAQSNHTLDGSVRNGLDLLVVALEHIGPILRRTS